MMNPVAEFRSKDTTHFFEVKSSYDDSDQKKSTEDEKLNDKNHSFLSTIKNRLCVLQNDINEFLTNLINESNDKQLSSHKT